ncbi:MAG: hypothetical protein KGJ13_09895, partial [Patescibacteria group bacterium]|nr:hypothetical protein [Patescibacteria group bacterium]
MKNLKITDALLSPENWNACKDGRDWFNARFPEGATLKKLLPAFDRADWMLWTSGKAEALSKRQFVWLAALCAERVIGEFEKKYPDDKRPRQAIEAAKNYVLKPSEGAAADAAWAAHAAWAAAADAARAAAHAA